MVWNHNYFRFLYFAIVHLRSEIDAMVVAVSPCDPDRQTEGNTTSEVRNFMASNNLTRVRTTDSELIYVSSNLLENDPMCEKVATLIDIFEVSIVIVLIINRFFTAFMTVMRLYCVTATSDRIARKSESYHIFYSLFCGVVLPILCIGIFICISALGGGETEFRFMRDNVWMYSTFSLSMATTVVTTLSAGV